VNIAELRLLGFKSFVDPARAPIEHGLTGVVGPNGCGKSNLLEAVRWVMGATSAKSMRAGDMEDVIFSGTAGRPAREFAEVTLLLTDARGRAPAPLHAEEVLEVTRRIRRGLGSTYRINGKEVRAKDVQLLFADAATGANSPALVRQGQISELIAAKPQNRRRILEDAAGIAGLHARRHEADLKLNAAEANLTRLDEVLAEIEGQAASLKKQARQAERYRGLAQTLRETEALLLHRRWREAGERAAEAQALARDAERAVAQAAADASAAERKAQNARDALGPLREEEMVAAAVLRRFEGVRVGLERDLAEAVATIERCDSDLRRTEEEMERLAALNRDAESALARLGDEADALGPGDDAHAHIALQKANAARDAAIARRNQAEALLEGLSADAAAKRARAQALNDAASAARARLQRLMDSRDALTAQRAALPARDDLDAKHRTAEQAARTARSALETLQQTSSASEAALKSAESEDEVAWRVERDAERAFSTLEAEVRALEKLAPKDDAAYPAVLTAIDVDPGYERALAAALGEDLDASTKSGAPAYWAGADMPAPHLPPTAQSLARFVRAPEALAARLALIGVVDAKDGPKLAKALTPGARLVSKEGDLWRWDGFVRRADAPQPAAARLEYKNRLSAAHRELLAAREALAHAKSTHAETTAKRSKLNEETRALRAMAPKLQLDQAQAVREAERLATECAHAEERRADLDAQADRLAREIAETEAASDLTSAAGPAPTFDEAALAAARDAVNVARAEAADASASAQTLTRDKAQRDARRAVVAEEIGQWRSRLDAVVARLTALDAECAAIQQQRKAAHDAPTEARAKLDALTQEAGSAEQRRAKASDAVAEAETAARLADDAVRAAEQAHAAAREARASAVAHVSAASARVDDVATQARDYADCAPEALAERAGSLLNGPLGAAPLHDIERRLDRLKAEREAAGPVNLRAEEELAETLQRVETLTREKGDVAQGVAKLRRAIATLNAEGRTRLMRAFEQVDAHFAQLFATLFEGGQAALKLTESEDPLEAGLEIFAQPPGKRLTNLSLLSGGEQALTATALIFAVFLANPAPLCVLDEVDAPLDDANVDRFCRMLEEMKRLTTTRFIVITHNPVTMSRMDRLYGVTMPEQGLSQLVSVDLSRAQAMAAE